MQPIDLQAVVEAYLKAFEMRDLSQCLDFFAEDGTIHFASGVYWGKNAIKEWHEDRFAADLRIVRLEGINVKGDMATVDVVATSNNIRLWKIGTLSARAVILFQDSKIKDAKFTLRGVNLFEGWSL